MAWYDEITAEQDPLADCRVGDYAVARAPGRWRVNELRGCRILLAEDGPDTQVLVCRVLERAGAEVTTADNGQEAVDEALVAARDGQPFDVVLMDMEMPIMDGYDAVRTLRQQYYTGPIIALTAHASAEAAGRCGRAGCDDYHAKPIDRESLVAAVERYASAGVGQASTACRTGAAADQNQGAIYSEFAGEPSIVGVLAGFVDRLPTRLEHMAEALAHGDYQGLHRLAHQLKGAAGMYGYPAVTAAATALERSARDRDIEAGTLALGRLQALAQRVVAGHASRAGADAGPTVD